MLLPILSSFDGLKPTLIQLLSLRLAHLRLESSCNFPLRAQLFLALPESDRKTGQVSSSQRGRLRHRRDFDRHIKDVCLKLHQKIVSDSSAIRSNLFQLDSRIALHRQDHIARLVAHALKRSARKVCAGRATRDACDSASRVSIPVRRAEPDQSRNEIDSVV